PRHGPARRAERGGRGHRRTPRPAPHPRRRPGGSFRASPRRARGCPSMARGGPAGGGPAAPGGDGQSTGLRPRRHGVPARGVPWGPSSLPAHRGGTRTLTAQVRQRRRVRGRRRSCGAGAVVGPRRQRGRRAPGGPRYAGPPVPVGPVGRRVPGTDGSWAPGPARGGPPDTPPHPPSTQTAPPRTLRCRRHGRRARRAQCSAGPGRRCPPRDRTPTALPAPGSHPVSRCPPRDRPLSLCVVVYPSPPGPQSDTHTPPPSNPPISAGHPRQPLTSLPRPPPRARWVAPPPPNCLKPAGGGGAWLAATSTAFAGGRRPAEPSAQPSAGGPGRLPRRVGTRTLWVTSSMASSGSRSAWAGLSRFGPTQTARLLQPILLVAAWWPMCWRRDSSRFRRRRLAAGNFSATLGEQEH
ncbi:unnamed protein product, partial [Bubo scandiacus]